MIASPKLVVSQDLIWKIRFVTNSKFIPTSTKLVGWVGKWYDPEAYPQKLQDDKHTTLFQQGKCWGCRESGHHGSDECYPLTNRRLNMTTARAVEEVSDSESEKT